MSLLVLAGCSSTSESATSDSAAALAAFRDTLVQFGVQDQQGRDSIGLAVARNDTLFLQRFTRADSTRTQWLRAHVAAHGWPRRSHVGDSAAAAAWLIVQHSADTAFQAAMLPLLEREAKAGEVRAADIATLSDRVAAHRKVPQRYGTQFSLHDGMLVADPIADLGTLDSLRATVGLPPMREYVQLLSQMNHLPVQWPPKTP